MLADETPPDPLDIAGEMSFLPKFSRLLETLLMLSGAAFVMEPELEKQIEHTAKAYRSPLHSNW